MSAGIWYVGNDEVERLAGLSYTNDAGVVVYFTGADSVTYAVTDAADVAVTVADVAVTGSYSLVSGSTTGAFVATIESTVTSVLVPGREYLLVVTAASGVNDGKWYLPRRAERRS